MHLTYCLTCLSSQHLHYPQTRTVQGEVAGLFIILHGRKAFFTLLQHRLLSRT